MNSEHKETERIQPREHDDHTHAREDLTLAMYSKSM